MEDPPHEREELRYERVGAAAVLTIDRPERAQRGRRRHRRAVAPGPATTSRPTRAPGCSSSPAPAASAFCAGADLKALDLDVDDPAGPMGFTRLTPSKPAIAAVDGWCLAGGLELALWCDLRIATPGSTFGLFERRWGVPLVDGGTQRLPRVVGMGRALELILTGRPVERRGGASGSASSTRWSSPARTCERALELAEKIASFPQETMLADRRAAIEGFGLPLDEGLALEHRLGREVLEVAVRGAARFAAGEGRDGEGALTAIDPWGCRPSGRRGASRSRPLPGRCRASAPRTRRSGRIRRSSGPRPARISSKIIEVAPPIAKRAVSAGSSSPWAETVAPFLEEVGEAPQRRPVADPRVLADGGHLDHRHAGDVVLGRPAARPAPAGRRRSGPARAAPTAALEGGRDVGDEDVDDRVVGLEEAGLLAGEHPVEGLAADRRGLDHVGDVGRLIPLGGGDPDHRLQQPLAFGADRIGPRQCLTGTGLGPWIRCRWRIHATSVGQSERSVQPRA